MDKYGKDDSLYPKDPQKRAVVNQRLFFDIGTFYQNFSDYYYPVMEAMMAKKTLVGDPKKYEKSQEAARLLDGFLANSKYAAGDEITIADFSLLPGVTIFDVSGFDYTPYPNILRWYELCKKTLPGVEYNEELVQMLEGFFKSIGWKAENKL